MLKIGEVLQAASGYFSAQCYELHQPPALGSLVKIREGTKDILAIVTGAQTRGIDPSRLPVARGANDNDQDDVFKANPQLARLLVTEFNAVITGYIEDGNLHCYLPPRPGHIHSFVFACTDDETRLFSSRLDFLDALVLSPPGLFQVDEVIAASLRTFCHLHPEPEEYLVAAGKHLTALIGDQLMRLNSILKRLK
jgi:hypothetical protein